MSQPLSQFADRNCPVERDRRAASGSRETTPLGEEMVASELLEHERDEARAQLDGVRTQLEQSRRQIVEVSKVLRQRDAAVQSAERTAEQLREVEAKLERLSRERNDAQRQRDDALRQRDEAKRGGSPANVRAPGGAPSQLADIQRQIVSIRQARDSSQAQNHELASQIARLEDEAAELGYARDAALKEAQAAREEAEEFRARMEALAGERDAAMQRVADFQSSLETERSKPAPEAGEELARLGRELLNISEERDALREKLRESGAELERHRRTPGEPSENDELRQALAEANAERERQSMREQELLAQVGAQEEQLAALQEQIATFRKSRDESLSSVSAAQKQIEHIVRERDALRQQSTQQTIELEAQRAALRVRATAAEPRAAEIERRLETLQHERDEALPKLAQFEAQRLQMIDLAAQLDAARRDILKLSADVAEARLQVKFAHATKNAPRATPAVRRIDPVEHEPFTVEINLDPPARGAFPAAPAPSPEAEAIAPASDEPPITASSEEPTAEAAGRSALATMKHCFQTFTKSPGDLRLLRELHAQIEAFSEGARVSGFVALHRLTGAFASFVLELHMYPELLNQASFRTVNGAIDFLGVLLKQKDYAALKDPATARVYVVDDEVDNCEAIRMGMETVMLRTHCAQDPLGALTQLTHERYDLIFLDVSMPQMGGFELCQRLRQTPMHARTPIVFLTGMTTIENRVQSSLSGGNDMIGKPFNVAELSLKALTLILRSSLNME